MNRVAARGGIVLLLVLALLFGVVFFVVEYAAKADDWVTFAGSPHVYNGNNIGCGVVDEEDVAVLVGQRAAVHGEG